MQVDQYKYLGSVISADGYCETEIHRGIAFMNTKKLFTGNLSMELKKENSKECNFDRQLVPLLTNRDIVVD